jgi:hypothetical protein
VTPQRDPFVLRLLDRLCPLLYPRGLRVGLVDRLPLVWRLHDLRCRWHERKEGLR